MIEALKLPKIITGSNELYRGTPAWKLNTAMPEDVKDFQLIHLSRPKISLPTLRALNTLAGVLDASIIGTALGVVMLGLGEQALEGTSEIYRWALLKTSGINVEVYRAHLVSPQTVFEAYQQVFPAVLGYGGARALLRRFRS